MKNASVFLLLLFSLTSCVDKYWPEVDKYENVLVVDGLLTNGEEPVLIQLSYSSSLENGNFVPASGGELFISDENQLEIPLIEITPGIYKAMDTSFRAQIGKSYQLHINQLNNQNYISDISTLLSPSPIDSVYGDIEIRENSNDNHDIYGIQFYLNNHSNTSDTCNYLWRLSQSFEYQSTFSIDYLWEGWFRPNPNPDSLRTCWLTSNVNTIFTMSTQYLNDPVITKLPLIYISTETKMLSIRYSLLVKQLSIPKVAFNFWDALRQQNIDQGNLYSQQPIQIRGNVRNINNPDEVVLGYFTVAGITEKRIFVNRPLINFYYDVCAPDFEGVAWLYYEMDPKDWPTYVVEIPNNGKAIGTNEDCFDCRLEGGTLTSPDFW